MGSDEKLSKEISYALRHHPEEYGLVLDVEGWVALDMLVDALRAHGDWEGLTCERIEDMVGRATKRRHEIEGGRIRARYGHSTETRIIKLQACPPDALYHGTAQRFVEPIFDLGLQPMERQYVHLSADEQTAERVGARHDAHPVILKVDAQRAWEAGVGFYREGDDIWLADAVPPEYLSILRTCEGDARDEG